MKIHCNFFSLLIDCVDSDMENFRKLINIFIYFGLILSLILFPKLLSSEIFFTFFGPCPTRLIWKVTFCLKPGFVPFFLSFSFLIFIATSVIFLHAKNTNLWLSLSTQLGFVPPSSLDEQIEDQSTRWNFLYSHLPYHKKFLCNSLSYLLLILGISEET